MDKIISYANTPEGKSQAKRLVDCRLNLGCTNAKMFFEKFSQDRFSYPQYQKYESGERLLSKKAAMLYANIFGVDWEWLKNGNDAASSNTPVVQEQPSEMISIDVLDVTACCGDGVENMMEKVIGKHLMTLPALRELTMAAPDNIKIIKAIGDSMMPTINPDDMVWVDVSFNHPSSDGLYLLCVGNDLLIKRIQINPFDNSAEIKSDNPQYTGFKYDHFENINVIGRIIYHIRKVG